MKAIKLASIFAVSAVAAAVSTTTIAAEPVFSGAAGISYTDTDGSDGSYGSEGEVDIKIDTGVVYMDLDWETNGGTTTFSLDEAYVTQGAVQFGDFDGSLIDTAAVYGGVDNGASYENNLDANLGVRYAVTDELTVAFEATESSDNDGLAVAYTTDLDVATLYLSGGVHGDDGSAVAAGAEIPLGAFTLAGYAQTGTTIADADMGSYAIGFDFAVSDALTFSAAYMENTENDDVSNVEFTAFYTAGDITYMLDVVEFSDEATAADSDDADFVKISAEASF